MLEGTSSPLPGIPIEAIGGMLTARNDAAIAIKLLPEHESEARRLGGMKRLAIRAVMCLLAIFIGLGALYYQAVAQRKRVVEQLQRRIAAIETNALGITEMREQLNILRRQVDRKGSVVEQLAALVESAPEEGLNFTRLSLRRGEGVNLWGRARSVNNVAQFTQEIRNRAAAQLLFFAQARSLYEQRATERNEEVWAYQIEISSEEGEDDAS